MEGSETRLLDQYDKLLRGWLSSVAGMTDVPPPTSLTAISAYLWYNLEQITLVFSLQNEGVYARQFQILLKC